MRSPSRVVAVLTAVAALATGCGSESGIERTYAGVESPACTTLTTTALVAEHYDGMPLGPPSEQNRSEGDDVVATCSLEDDVPPGDDAAAAPLTERGLPRHVRVAVTVDVLAEGDPRDNFERLEGYGERLAETGGLGYDVSTSEAELDGWFSRGRTWRTTWLEGTSARHLVETASVSRDNVLVTVLVIERGLAEDALPAAEERVAALVQDQVDAVESALVER